MLSFSVSKSTNKNYFGFCFSEEKYSKTLKSLNKINYYKPFYSFKRDYLLQTNISVGRVYSVLYYNHYNTGGLLLWAGGYKES